MPQPAAIRILPGPPCGPYMGGHPALGPSWPFQHPEIKEIGHDQGGHSGTDR